jgi:DNA polymerase/3'-5' exonuclease PolX
MGFPVNAGGYGGKGIVMKLEIAKQIADKVLLQLQPHCERIAIAGSIRRKKEEVKDIEIVAIPKPFEVGLFSSGIASVVNQWEKVKGELPCKYTQRILPEGIKLDLFFAEPENWGLIFAIRTGSAEYSHKILASGWVKAGYTSREGYLWHGNDRYNCREEIDLFNRIQLKYVEPELRDL